MACCFCGKSSSSSMSDGGALLALASDLFAHELCVVFSSGYEVDVEEIPDDYTVGCLKDVRVESVRSEARRGRRLRCSLCGERGASIGCYTCSEKCFHYPCASRAGLVEWHWWRSGNRAQVVHCTQHLDPRCLVEYDGEWYEAAVADGPQYGRFHFIYVESPYEEESLILTRDTIACRPPPTGAARWATFKALCDANFLGNVPLPPRRSDVASNETKTTRCVLAGAPLDCPNSNASAEEVPIIARPLAATARKRAKLAEATRRAFREVTRPGAARAERAFSGRTRVLQSNEPASHHVAWIVRLALEFLRARDVCSMRACGAEVYDAVPAERLFKAELERELGTARARDMIACFQGRRLDALRWISGNSLRWAAKPKDDAGTSGSSIHKLIQLGATSSWNKPIHGRGDVTLACIEPLPKDACVCWEFKISQFGFAPEHQFYLEEATFGICTGLSGPSAFWLGGEPRSGVGGSRSFGMSSFDYIFTNIETDVEMEVVPRFLASQQNLSIAVGDRIGFLVDTREFPAILGLYRNGILCSKIEDPSFSEDFLSRSAYPAASLWSPHWLVSIYPAIPLFGNGDDSERLPPFIQSWE